MPLIGLTAVATGCSQSRELIVHFAPDATRAQQEAALAACAGVAAHTSPEPLPSAAASSGPAGPLRFRIDSASDRDLAQLEICLGKQPGVVGAEDTGAVTG